MTQDTTKAEDVQEAQEAKDEAHAASTSSSSSSSSASGGQATASAAAASADLAALEADIERLTAALAEAKEMAMRAQAEAQNTRRRAEQDVERAHKYALEKFVGDMIPVADNLERAIAAAAADSTGDVGAVIEGVELTLKTLLDGLKRHNVVQIDPANEPFDPQQHQAMTAVANGEVEPNTVLDVFQKGYSLNGRLVRPAMVVVAKAPAQ